MATPATNEKKFCVFWQISLPTGFYLSRGISCRRTRRKRAAQFGLSFLYGHFRGYVSYTYMGALCLSAYIGNLELEETKCRPGGGLLRCTNYRGCRAMQMPLAVIQGGEVLQVGPN